MKAKVLTEEPHVQSPAALILLGRRLIRSVVYRGYQGWLRFRLETLEKWKAQRGSLSCHYCGKGPLIIEADNRHPFVATLDHVIPRSRGGAEMDENNLVVACFACNQRKRDKLVHEMN